MRNNNSEAHINIHLLKMDVWKCSVKDVSVEAERDVYDVIKQRATSILYCLSLFVGMRRLERPTPTSRT